MLPTVDFSLLSAKGTQDVDMLTLEKLRTDLAKLKSHLKQYVSDDDMKAIDADLVPSPAKASHSASRSGSASADDS